MTTQDSRRDAPVIVDVRTPEEFGTGHIAGATNIPLQELQARMDELGSKQRPLLVYCRSGGRSAAAVALLRRFGFAKAEDLGGLSDAKRRLS